ncbi:MAG: tRNA (adenosine(37)-N6)-dimethylallyltransferase, partial [Anaerolineales bacterium]
EQRGRAAPRYSIFQLGLTRPRRELYERIDARLEKMIAAGLVDEVRALIARGYSSDLPSLSAIGYREVTRHLQGEITLEEAVALIKRNTRRFVRRQANWFKKDDPEIHWFGVGPGTADKMAAIVLKFLGNWV